MACPSVENPVDEGVRVVRRALTLPAPRSFQDRTDPLGFPDDYLFERYRFRRHSIVYLCKLLGPYIEKTRRSKALTKPQTVCIALTVAHFCVGDAERLSKATRFLNIFIKFPGDRGILPIKEAFFRTAGFPNAIGAIDCTHIQIKAPSGPTEADYVKQKSFHSINVQMICTRFAQGAFPGLLLGDRGYPCQPFLLTPYADPTTYAERRFNRAHSKTRACIEMAFGQLKSRFNCLRHLRVTPERACDIVAACAVLQYCRKKRCQECSWSNGKTTF
uniref:DDE Tnp4 domain-containing protein n=1 Tax=Pygocentrus nattereri TaxID=42514 RepID=A0AAR2LM61_PYGNA